MFVKKSIYFLLVLFVFGLFSVDLCAFRVTDVLAQETLVDQASVFSVFDDEIARIDTESDIYNRIHLYVQLCHVVASDTWLSVNKRMLFLDQLFCHMILQVNHEVVYLLEQRAALDTSKAPITHAEHTAEIEKLNSLNSSKDLLSGQALLTALDMPFILLFLGIIFFIQPVLVCVPIVMLLLLFLESSMTFIKSTVKI